MNIGAEVSRKRTKLQKQEPGVEYLYCTEALPAGLLRRKTHKNSILFKNGAGSMITAISSISNCGVFDSYKAATSLPQFQRFNIFYGPNASGKTTLTRLFNAIATGKSDQYPTLAFEVRTEIASFSPGQTFPHPIRVFNADYIKDNIGEIKDHLQHILILGSENKKILEVLEKDRSEVQRRNQLINSASSAKDKLDTERGKRFSEIAKTIGESISTTTSRTYRKPDAELAFQKLGHPKLLDARELRIYRSTLRQEEGAYIEEPPSPRVGLSNEEHGRSFSDALNEIERRARTLLKRTVQIDAIERLIQNPDIGKWIEDGLKIHEVHKSSVCEFCAQNIPERRLNMLARHFNDADEKLAAELRNLTSDIYATMDAFETLVQKNIPAREAFYSEFREEYTDITNNLHLKENNIAAGLNQLEQEVAKKLGQRTEAFDLDVNIRTLEFENAINNLVELIRRNNAKTDSFRRSQEEARGLLESHFLSTIHTDITQLDKKISELNCTISDLQSGKGQPDQRSLQALKDAIAQNQNQITDAHKASAFLTENICAFLGRNDFAFESTEIGYRITRNGAPAKLISEGEKTAIAFLYFLVQLQDKDFSHQNGIVVIDDPISSLDSASIYQAFAFLKGAIRNTHQCFLLTHNYEFLRILLDWVQHGKPKSHYKHSLFMVRCTKIDACRRATILEMDRLLVKYRTEYQYQFKLLYEFKSDGTIANSYHIPNTARKALETYLSFHIPSPKSMHAKLETIDFDENKKTAIAKFLNDASHATNGSFDPALIQETQKAVSYLLEMIKCASPKHYLALEEAANS